MNTKEKIKILIVEDHTLTRFGLKTAFGAYENACIVGEANNGETGIELVCSLKPDIVILDIGLPDMDGVEVANLIKEKEKSAKIIMLTSHNNEKQVWASFAAGANAYCLKDIEPERLIQVVESVNDGALWFDPAVSGMVMKILTAQHTIENSPAIIESENGEKISLTDRENEVLKLIVEGFGNGEIAEKLFVSIHTVKAHVCNILQKLSVEDRTQAAIKALKDGLV